MFYAVAGIPLGLIMFQSIGERLNTFTSFIIKHIKKCLKLKDNEVGRPSGTDFCVAQSMLGQIYSMSSDSGIIRASALILRVMNHLDATFLSCEIQLSKN